MNICGIKCIDLTIETTKFLGAHLLPFFFFINNSILGVNVRVA